MDERADRCGAFHGIGQPDVQRKLCALAHRAAEDKQARHRCDCPKSVRVGAQFLLQDSKVQRAKRRPNRQNAKDEPEISQSIGDERLLAGVSGGGLFEPKSDEQIAGNAD